MRQTKIPTWYNEIQKETKKRDLTKRERLDKEEIRGDRQAKR